jgi:microcystin degradation protein MlrC
MSKYDRYASSFAPYDDRVLLRTAGNQPEQMRIVVVNRFNHFRAGFQLRSRAVLVAKAAELMVAGPSDLPRQRLLLDVRRSLRCAGATEPGAPT